MMNSIMCTRISRGIVGMNDIPANVRRSLCIMVLVFAPAADDLIGEQLIHAFYLHTGAIDGYHPIEAGAHPGGMVHGLGFMMMV